MPPTAPVDVPCMRHPSQISDRFSAEWLAGYRAAIAELEAALEAVSSPAFDSVAPLVRARLRARLLALEFDQKAA